MTESTEVKIKFRTVAAAEMFMEYFCHSGEQGFWETADLLGASDAVGNGFSYNFDALEITETKEE